MSKDIREFLEGVAVDMVIASMARQGEPHARANAWEHVAKLSDNELLEFITE